jgi:hypothetical protein
MRNDERPRHHTTCGAARERLLGTTSNGPPSLIGRVGSHRPVYFWAGPDTLRVNRLKFMDQPVNEAVHLAGHTRQAAQMLTEVGFNWTYPSC